MIKKREMKKIFVSLFLIVFAVPTILFSGGSTKAAQDKYTLEITLWHSLTGEQIKHEIYISEESKFAVTANIGNTKWHISGTPGKFTDKKIPIKIRTEWYNTEKGNSRSNTEMELEPGKESASGIVHGITHILLIKKNKPG